MKKQFLAFSCWKRLAGVFWLESALCMVVFTFMNVSHGLIPLRSVHSKNNTFVMQRESWNWLLIWPHRIAAIKCNSKIYPKLDKKTWNLKLNKCCSICRELSGTFARLCRVVDTATTDMTDELKKIEGELAILEANQKQLKLLRNKANYITSELDIFDTNYIRPN